ncbi:MAG: DUF4065 domain-containing protein [Caloramator sp.]|nr:DUF4065 domain-containing protein [Caloramator sp.]
MKKVYCPNCNEYVEYKVKQNLIKEYKGKEVNIVENIAYCKKCGEDLFVEKIEEDNLKRLYEKYRQVADLINPEQIIKLREKYGLSQRELGAILGWGKMTINRYERGGLPSQSHSDLLKLMLEDEEFFKEKVEEAYNKGRISNKTYNKINNKLGDNIKFQKKKYIINLLSHEENIYNGYKKFDFEKVENLIAYLADKINELYQTNLNKLLWYIDFIYYKHYVTSITGLRYVKFYYGPVIEKRGYVELLNYPSEKFIIEEQESIDGTSTILKIKSNKNYDLSMFEHEEIKVINKVIDKFKNVNCKEISKISHEEVAWLETPFNELISYDYADNLKIDIGV